jgi:hypothetical protein
MEILSTQFGQDEIAVVVILAIALIFQFLRDRFKRG